jgi:hypothetical protein
MRFYPTGKWHVRCHTTLERINAQGEWLLEGQHNSSQTWQADRFGPFHPWFEPYTTVMESPAGGMAQDVYSCRLPAE